jgi:NADH dehydrogenase
MSEVVTIFGGTGFIGGEITRAAVSAGLRVRLASRHSPRAPLPPGVTHVVADLTDEAAVLRAVQGATAVVNAVALFIERGALTFEAVHVQGAARVARCAGAAGARVLVHISGLGVDTASPSAFVRARALGEQAVRAAFPGAAIVRPSVIFGPDDSFLTSLDKATRLPPLVPLFGRGHMLLQPVSVQDVATAVVRIVQARGAHTDIFELGGARRLSYRQIVEAVLAQLGRRRLLVPLPFTVWKIMVAALSVLPSPPLTRDQLILMQGDNVTSGREAGFAELGIQPAGFPES